MDPQDAFRFLGLDRTATPQAVDEKYRELAKELHPDHGGTDESIAQLGAARSVAMSSLNYWGSLVSALAAIRSGQEQQRMLAERVAKAEETLRIRSSATPLRQRRKAGGIVAAVSAAALFLGNQLPPEVLNRPLVPTLDAATELAWMDDAPTIFERPDALATFALRELLLLQIMHDLRRIDAARPGSIPVAYNDLDLDAVSEVLDGEAFFEFIDRLRQNPDNSMRVAYFARNLWALSEVWEQFSGPAPDGAMDYLRVLRPRLRLGTQEANDANRALDRAYELKEYLATILGQATPEDAPALLDEWLEWAARSRLTPFVKLGRTIRKHAEGILAYLDTKMTNGPVEGINNKLRVIARRAYGFHSPGALISMLFLCCGGIELAPPLPTRI